MLSFLHITEKGYGPTTGKCIRLYIKLYGFSLEKTKLDTSRKLRNINKPQEKSPHFNREAEDSIAWKLSLSCSVKLNPTSSLGLAGLFGSMDPAQNCQPWVKLQHPF